MLHLALHVLVPLLVALAFYRARWRQTLLILVATMLVDLDHLVADPIYDPDRCSIGFHHDGFEPFGAGFLTPVRVIGEARAGPVVLTSTKTGV